MGLLFLLLTLLISAVWGWQVGMYSAVITNLALNFFFIEPLYKFTVQNSNPRQPAWKQAAAGEAETTNRPFESS